VALAQRQKPEVVFHIAAQSSVSVSVADPMLDATVNAVGTVNVLEAARAAGSRKVVYAASGGTIYGAVDPRDLPVKESHPQMPLSPYGVSKKVGHDYLTAYRDLHQLEFTSLALANVYGPRQDPHGEAGVVAIFVGKLKAGEPPKIFGDGRQTRDYVYAGDVARATLAAAGQDGGVFNVGTGQETSVLDLYELCRRIAGSELEAEPAPPRLGELQRSVLDVSLAQRQLGWQAEVSLEEGLRRTWESVG
jgi:UDP-glucose 4-epimerase